LGTAERDSIAFSIADVGVIQEPDPKARARARVNTRINLREPPLPLNRVPGKSVPIINSS